MNRPVFVRDCHVNVYLDDELMIKDFITATSTGNIWIVSLETACSQREIIKDNKGDNLHFDSIHEVSRYLADFGVSMFYVSILGGVE